MWHVLLFMCLFYESLSQYQCGNNLVTLYNNNQIVTCNPQNPTTCSSSRAGYFCQMASQGSVFLCCGAQSQQCGSNSPQLGSNGQAQICQLDSNCFAGFSCSSGICCPSSSTGSIQIGGSCSASFQCAGGASCFNSQCVCATGLTNVNGVCSTSSNGNCANGQVYVNGVCYNSVQIGNNCIVSQQCPTNAMCSNSFCVCNTNYQNINGVCTSSGSSTCQVGQVLVNNQCMSYASPGAYCTSSLQCLEGAQCTGNICACQNNRIQLNGYCISYSGGPCTQSQTYYNGQCYTYSLPGSQCVAPGQCVGGSNCSSNVCQCSANYVAMYGYCVPTSNQGSCSSGQVSINNQCYNMVSLGGYCIYSQQCQQGTCQNSVCTYSSSNCNTGQVLINGICYNQVQNGGYCVYTQQCVQGNCQNNICTSSTTSCGVNKVLINNLCYDQVAIGFSCSYAQQCLGGSTCVSFTCQCPQGSFNNNGYCTYSNGSSNGCKSYEVYVNSQCYAKMPILSSCSVVAQCPTGASCSGQCLCNNGYSYDGTQCSSGITLCSSGYVSYSGQCRALRSLGQSCSINQECLAFGQCINSICSCASGSSTDNYGVCRQQGQTSQCGTSAVLINNQCYNTAQIGANCQYSQQCLGNSQCSNNICQCSSGMTNVNGMCTTGSSSLYTCSRTGYYAPLQNNQPINCLFNYCPDQYNSVCEYNYQAQYYICCTKTSG